MATVWLTYSWDDNNDGDVDFAAQELIRAGVQVKLDRWNLGAGKRLWEQIAYFIQETNECAAWMIYATQHSLSSEPCREELAYALERALKTRGEAFPVIALFPTVVDADLVPPSLSTRLCVSLTDPDWKERIKAAAEHRSPSIKADLIAPYSITYHRTSTEHLIEMRPRAGTWSRFFVAIPPHEKDEVEPYLTFGSSGRIPSAAIMNGPKNGLSDDEKWWVMAARNQATPVESYFLQCKRLPSEIWFGEIDGPQYHCRVEETPLT